MQQDTTHATPSKGEVAFRFISCTAIALALYYTPELKWAPVAAEGRTAWIHEAPDVRVATVAVSCSPGSETPVSVDAASMGN